MKLREALEKVNWKAFQMNGLSYQTQTVLENEYNVKWLEVEASIHSEEPENPWDLEIKIIECRNQIFSEIDELACSDHNTGGFRKNGLLLG